MGEPYELMPTSAATSASRPYTTAAATRRTMRSDAEAQLHRRTLLKLDCLLLPFLALLFLFNSLDKSNIGNAESAHFTTDIGLNKGDLNTAVVLFFAFFVALQPAGAALGRRYGMVAWVPSCMLLWGIATALHVWVRRRWQLYALRIIIGCLEAGFYPVTVSYLSLFYTRFEFGRRLSLFYGQAAVGGALGGIISYVVFSHFPDRHGEPGGPDIENEWQAWQVLFLLEGSLTTIVAMVGYVWLPHSVETAWFLSPEERKYASSRVLQDREVQEERTLHHHEVDEDDVDYDEESRNLLSPARPAQTVAARASIDDRGLTPHDVLSAFLNTRIWHILACNILSAVPVYAFSVFLPLVLAPLTKKSSPALVNLLTAPPHVAGAACLYAFASYSDKHRIRLKPILLGLAIMVSGLTAVVVMPTSWPIPRYLSLTVLVSGSYIASPLTVAWISGNTPSPGKRALLLGINGWGNLAGVISATLFRPKHAASGYIVPFWWTLGCVALAAIGYILLLKGVMVENERRQKVLDSWDEEDLEREKNEGRGSPVRQHVWAKRLADVASQNARVAWLGDWLRDATKGGREGDEKITFVYGL